MGKHRKDVFERITDRIAGAITESLRQGIAVTVDYSETRIDDWIENRMDPKLNHPQNLKVLRFKKENGAVAGFMIFMAAHPTLFPAKSLLFSADYPGVLAREVESRNPDAVALFVNGAAGDLRPHTPSFADKIEGMEHYGKQLAHTVETADYRKENLKGPWSGTFRRVKLPRVKIRLGWFRVPSFLGNRIFPRKTSFQALRLGSLLFITFPGELASDIGYAVEKRQRAKSLKPFLVGYANDYIAYAVSPHHYLDRHGYEASVSFYGNRLSWFYQEKVEGLVAVLLTETEKRETPGELYYYEGLPVLKLRGNAYTRGFEEGRLLKEQIREGTSDIFRYFRSELPIPLVNRFIINFIADRAWKKMEPYISYDEYQLLKGLSNGSGVSFKKLRRIHAMPELFPTFCSNGAYWGEATSDGRLIALRNLDWNRKMGVHGRAAIKYIETGHGPDYVNIGYYGFSGVLSGINEKGISVGQIGATSDDETMEGVPMPFLLKRILAQAQSLDDAVRIFERTHRTRGYNYVIADALRKEAMAVETTHHHLAFFRDNDASESGVSYALPVPNAVFRGDPALNPLIRDLQWASRGDPEKPGLEIPSGSAYEIRYLKHGQLVKDYYGKIDPDTAKLIAREIAPRSNIQSVIYKYPEFWVANARGDKRAAEMEYIHFNFEELSKRTIRDAA